jgi:hypothetical protein
MPNAEQLSRVSVVGGLSEEDRGTQHMDPEVLPPP